MSKPPSKRVSKRGALREACLAIVGPTASGKTQLAIAVARSLGGEIISLDSRQAYRGFRVGSAAPTDEDLSRAPHHGVGILEPDERYGAGRFAEFATATIHRVVASGNVPILAGGTGLFLRALTHPMFREPEVDPVKRDRLRHWLDEADPRHISRWARRLESAIDLTKEPLDPQRAARSVELALTSGRPLSWWIEHGERERPPLDARIYALDVPGEVLRARIEGRAREMVESGDWEAEVRTLERAGHAESRAFDAIGYHDILAVTRGQIGRQEALGRIVSSTWAYARRQRTWFRHQLPEASVRLDGSKETAQLARRIEDDWRSRPQRSGRE